MKKIILLSVFILLQQNLFAQKSPVKIIMATEQSWSGGVEGNEGVRFYIKIQMPKTYVPDTFWFGGYSMKGLSLSNYTMTTKGSKTILSGTYDFSYPNKILDANMDGVPDEIPPPKKRDCKYELIFKNGERICFTHYLTLESLAYP